MADDAFALPAFNPTESLIRLKRALRDLRLAERGATYVYKGRTVIELSCDDAAIHARLAKRPALTPEWQSFTLKNSPDLRRFTDEVGKRAAAWGSDDN